LHWQLGDFENARQNRVASDEAQLVQPWEADVEPQHDSQHEPVQVHRSGNSLRGHRLFHQGPEVEFLQHGDHRQQTAVGGQILTIEVIGRGSPNSIGLRRHVLHPLFHGRFGAILFSVCNHLGDLLGVGSAKRQLRKPLFYLNIYGVPKWFTALPPSCGQPQGRIAQVS
jgi:hypothetical protein